MEQCTHSAIAIDTDFEENSLEHREKRESSRAEVIQDDVLSSERQSVLVDVRVFLL